MGEPQDATGAYASALRALHEAAGSPIGRMIERRAAKQVPPLKVTEKSWSDWRNGKNVPSDEAKAAFLISYLRARARHKTPEYVAPPDSWWEQTRLRARAERSQGKGRGGRPPHTHPSSPPPVVSAQHQIGLIPLEADCYQVREAAEQLEQTAARDGTVVLCQVLAGMGGVGKTQLAAAYARYAWQHGVQVLVWAAASSRQAIIDAYAAAAVKLGLDDMKDPERAAREFLVWTDSTTISWLVVLDDVHDPGDLRELWPSHSPAGITVVTTRRRDAALAGPGRRLVQVGMFTHGEARTYLHAKLGPLADDDEQVEALAGDLGWLPLALAQATAFMIDQDIGCADYRELLAERLLRHVVPEHGGLPDDHQKIIAATWDLSVEQADKARPAGLARPVLYLASVLDPNGIPAAVFTSEPARDYLATYLPGPADLRSSPTVSEHDAAQALRILHRFNLVDHDRHSNHQEVRIHQLVQRATRETFADPDWYAALADTAADALMAAWPDVPPGQLGHVLRANTAALHANTGSALWHQSDKVHPVLLRAARSLAETGQPAGAVMQGSRLLEIANRVLGPDHHDTLTLRHDLAHWRGLSGDVQRAIIETEDVLAVRVRLLGPRHLHTLTTRNNLASWYGRTGDVVRAEKETRKLLDDYLQVLWPDHHDVLITRGNLARWQALLGDPAGAAENTRDLLADYLRILGPRHPHTLITRGNLAQWQAEAGNLTDARAAAEQLLEDMVQILGPDHPETLTTRSTLAHLQGRSGDPAGAASAYSELLADRSRVLGGDHPSIKVTQDRLAYWREQAGLAE